MKISAAKRIVGRVAYWTLWPLWRYSIRGSRRTRVVLRVKDEILVVQGTLSSGRWSLPGGGVHRGEDPAAAAKREVYEELRVDIDAKSLRPLGTVGAGNGGIAYTAYLYEVEIHERPDIRLNIETVETRWVKLSEVQHLRAEFVLRAACDLLMDQ